MVNVPTSLNNLKTKVDALDVGKLKTVPIDLEKLSDDKKVIENTKFNKLNTKINNLEKKISEATALIHINQYNTDKQSLEKKIGDVDEKYLALVVYWLQLFLIQKLEKLRIKYQMLVV